MFTLNGKSLYRPTSGKFYLGTSPPRYKYAGRFAFRYPTRPTADWMAPPVAPRRSAFSTLLRKSLIPSKPLSMQAAAIQRERSSRLRYPIKAKPISTTPSVALGILASPTPKEKLLKPSMARRAQARYVHAEVFLRLGSFGPAYYFSCWRFLIRPAYS